MYHSPPCPHASHSAVDRNVGKFSVKMQILSGVEVKEIVKANA